MEADHTELKALSRQECLALLATVSVGRIVFTEQALPAVRPVGFAVDDGCVVIRSAASSKLATTQNMVVAFEADRYDPEARTGWYVTLTGLAQPVRDPDDVSHLRHLRLCPWPPGQGGRFIRVCPAIISGHRIAKDIQEGADRVD
ncbi:MAG: pyridoxamine 5'-phosphate oxidase family protein [Nocardioidaceae bacterium]